MISGNAKLPRGGQPVGLADQLRAATRAEHRAAERRLLLRCFAHGAVDRAVYRQLLSDLRLVYERMEAAFAITTCPALAAVWDPVLARVDRLARDLDSHGGAIAPSSPARRYADSIDDRARTQPMLLIAHVYTRYLGDLAGGQILRRLVLRGLGDSTSVECYQFDADPSELRIALRARIDAIPIDDPMATALCHEARRVFACNHALFTALGPARYRDVVRLTLAALLP